MPLETAQLDWLAPFNPLKVRAKGRPAGLINLAEGEARWARSTRRDASLFEHIKAAEREEAAGLSESRLLLPLIITAPPLLTAPPTITHVTNGLIYIERHGDSYEPGTEEPRASARALRNTPDDDIEARVAGHEALDVEAHNTADWD